MQKRDLQGAETEAESTLVAHVYARKHSYSRFEIEQKEWRCRQSFLIIIIDNQE